MEPRKQAIIDALAKFMNQRSGIEFANYGDVKAFRAEQRSIYTDLKQARELLAAVKWRDGIDADALTKAASGAYSGRLTITENADCRACKGYGGIAPPKPRNLTHKTCAKCSGTGKRGLEISYCTGQYFPTEYRRAVCAVLASALWDYVREKCMPAPGARPMGLRDAGDGAGKYWDGKSWASAGDWLHAHFRKEFGRTIANRWFT